MVTRVGFAGGRYAGTFTQLGEGKDKLKTEHCADRFRETGRRMKKLIYTLLALTILAGYQLPTNAGPPNNPAAASHYTAVLTCSGWEGAAVRIKLTLIGRTLPISTPFKAGSPQTIRVNGLQAGIYTATVSLLSTDAKHSLVTVLGCNIFTPGTAIKVISVANHSFSDADPFYSIGIDAKVAGVRGEANIDTVWGQDVTQIPDIPYGKDYYARLRIGDTCKIVFSVGPDDASSTAAQPLPPVSCPHYREMLVQADYLEKLADTLQTNDEAYQSAVIDMLLQGYDSDYARLGLAIDEDDISSYFDYDRIPKIPPGEGSIVDARKNIVQSIRSKANALKAIADAGIYKDYGLNDDGYLSKDAVQYFCSLNSKSLSDGAWEGLYRCGYIDYPAYRQHLWKQYAYEGFSTAVSFLVVGKAFDVAAFAVPKVFARTPLRFRTVSFRLGALEAKELASVADRKLLAAPISPVAKVFNSVSADNLNAEEVAAAKALGQEWFPAWEDGSLVREVTLSKERSFVRVYWKGMKNGVEINRQEGPWATFKPEDIEGLTAEQIRAKFALPNAPNYICDVIAPSGTKLRVGWAREQPQWNAKGGGRQIQILPIGDTAIRVKYVNGRSLP